ncbi:MAG: 2-succinyl-5-enolpyruvyl-6-hydroxy-3-cyclohexene-1-carboxylic-acid synthase [Deltaproteobacteria bacterium]|nr:2-succinyl-5-enolpyruvyl-6-hydroxy-3-cyclohexene-1-carboxylic-acid synthase [Deltaproteobacteria bacterium]
MNDVIIAAKNRGHAQALIQSLAACKVNQVVISPGSRSTPLVLTWADCPSVNITTVLDERTAGFMALGIAKASGNPVALVCTSGSAPAHYLPAIIEANYSNIPLIVLTADRPIELHHCGTLQTVEQSYSYGQHVRAFIDLAAPAAEQNPQLWLRQVAARMVDTACKNPRGPVHINIPFREPLWSNKLIDSKLPESTPKTPPPIEKLSVLRSKSTVDDNMVKTLVQHFTHAPRGVIVCGPIAPAYKLADSIYCLAAKLGWPIIAEPTSQLRFSTAKNGQNLVIAAADLILRVPEFVDNAIPDLIVRFGQTPTSKALQNWLAQVGLDKIILINESGVWHDPSHNAAMLVVANPKELCSAVFKSFDSPLCDHDAKSLSWLQYWQRADAAAQQELEAICTAGFWEGGVARIVAANLPNNSALHIASSMPIRDLDDFAPYVQKDIKVYANRGTNGIDGLIATVAGEAIAEPERLHFLLLGDLAFLHDLSSLRVTTQLQIPLVIILINNSGGGIFSFLPIAEHPYSFAKHFRTDQKANLEALVKASDANWQHATSYVELNNYLQQITEQIKQRPGVYVIGLNIDLEHNVQQHKQAAANVQRAILAVMTTEGE